MKGGAASKAHAVATALSHIVHQWKICIHREKKWGRGHIGWGGLHSTKQLIYNPPTHQTNVIEKDLCRVAY